MKKKNNFLSFATLVVATVLTSSFALCGCSDEESYVPSPTITDTNGNKVQVTSAGNFRFTYDESGKLTSLSDGYRNYVIQGDKFTISDSDDFYFEIYLNKDGNITKLQWTEDDGEVYKGTTKYSYDSDGRLKKCRESGEIKDDEGGSGTWTAEANYTWKNGNLMQAKIEYKENYKEGDGESWSWSFTDDYTYTYGTQVNFSKQFPYYMDDQITFFEDNIGGFFNVIGLYGFGPAYLPTDYTITDVEVEDGKAQKPVTHNYTLSFTQNSNGTLNSETCNGSIFYYNYGTTRSDNFGSQSFVQYLRNQCHRPFRHKKQ